MLMGADDLVPATLDASTRERLAATAKWTVPLAVAGMPCAVHFDDLETAAIFGRRYVDLGTTHRAVVHAYAIAHGPGGPLLWCSERPVFRWPHVELGPRELAFLCDAVAITGFITSHVSALSLHAAAVGRSGGVAAIVGDSHAGKTTTALACARAGMRLYTDERCLIDDGFVVPFPRTVNVRAGGVAALAEDPVPPDALAAALQRHGRRDWDDARLVDLFADWKRPKPAPLRSIFVVAGFGARAEIERTTRAEVVRSAGRWAQCSDSGLERVARLVNALSAVACYRITLGRPSDTASLIAETLARDTPLAASIAS